MDIFYLKDEKDPLIVLKKGAFLNQVLLDEGFNGKLRKNSERKRSEYQNWFNTFQLAKEYLIAKKISELESLAEQHVIKSNELTKIEEIKESS